MDFLLHIPDVYRMAFQALGLEDASDYDVIDLVSSDKKVVDGEPTIPLSEKEVGELPMPPPEDVEEEVLMPPLEVEEELQPHVGPL